MAEDQQIDVVVVGSSIIAMFEALLAARRGRRVVVVERAAVTGGSWRTLETAWCTGLNNGSHLFRNHPAYQLFLEAHSGVTFAPLEPQPESFWGDLPMKEDSPAHHAAVFLQRAWQLLRSLRGAVPRDIASRRRYALALVRFPLVLARSILRPPGPFSYPAAGLADLLSQLERQLQAEGANVALETRVDHLDVDHSARRVAVVTDRGTWTAERVVLFTNTAFDPSPTFRLDPVQPLTTMRYPHLCLVVEDRAPKAFSHLSFLDDPSIIRINDYTEVVTIREAHRGRPLKILHGWVRDRVGDRAAQASAMLERLRGLGRVGPDARLLDWLFYDHEVTINSPVNIRAIHRAHLPLVRVVDSFSMVDGILDVRRRWEDAFG